MNRTACFVSFSVQQQQNEKKKTYMYGEIRDEEEEQWEKVEKKKWNKKTSHAVININWTSKTIEGKTIERAHTHAAVVFFLVMSRNNT